VTRGARVTADTAARRRSTIGESIATMAGEAGRRFSLILDRHLSVFQRAFILNACLTNEQPRSSSSSSVEIRAMSTAIRASAAMALTEVTPPTVPTVIQYGFLDRMALQPEILARRGPLR